MNAERIILSAKTATETHRFGRHKVFLSHFANKRGEISAVMQHFLIEAHRAGKIRLSRADLIPAMGADMVKASEIAYMNATFHFIDLEGF